MNVFKFNNINTIVKMKSSIHYFTLYLNQAKIMYYKNKILISKYIKIKIYYSECLKNKNIY